MFLFGRGSVREADICSRHLGQRLGETGIQLSEEIHDVNVVRHLDEIDVNEFVIAFHVEAIQLVARVDHRGLLDELLMHRIDSRRLAPSHGRAFMQQSVWKGFGARWRMSLLRGALPGFLLVGAPDAIKQLNCEGPSIFDFNFPNFA